MPACVCTPRGEWLRIAFTAVCVRVTFLGAPGQLTCDSPLPEDLAEHVVARARRPVAVSWATPWLQPLWCLTVVGIPFGVASFRLGMYALWPFGRDLVKKPGAGVASGLGNFFWFILSGLWLAIGHAITGVLLCLTIIGIPLGVANFKLVPVALMPLGREIVPSRDVAAAFAASRAS